MSGCSYVKRFSLFAWLSMSWVGRRAGVGSGLSGRECGLGVECLEYPFTSGALGGDVQAAVSENPLTELSWLACAAPSVREGEVVEDQELPRVQCDLGFDTF